MMVFRLLIRPQLEVCSTIGEEIDVQAKKKHVISNHVFEG